MTYLLRFLPYYVTHSMNLQARQAQRNRTDLYRIPCGAIYCALLDLPMYTFVGTISEA